MLRRWTVSFALALTLAAGVEATHSESAISDVENRLLPTWWIEIDPPAESSLAARMAHYNTPAVSVAVVLNGKIAWAKAWGLSDVGTNRPATVETRFQAASISKPVAALAALDMAEDGLLNLDEDVNRQLISWKLPDNEFTATEKVTARRILNHSAGLTVWGFPGYAPDVPRPDAVGVLDGRGNTDPVRVYKTPGESWQYSGGGYTVLQVLLTDLAGKPFEALMRERVLNPLGMTHSSYDQPLPAQLRPLAASGYRSSGDPVSGNAHVYPEQAAAGLWTTPSDLARYLIAVQQSIQDSDGGVLQRDTTMTMLTPGDQGHGLGPAISEDGLYFGHGGSNEGFRARILGALDGSAGVAVMTNADPGYALAMEVIHALARHYDWPGLEPEIKTTVSLTTQQLKLYAGEYDIADMGKVTVVPDDEALLISTSFTEGEDRYLPEGEHQFFDADDGQTFVFTVSDGRAVGFVIEGRVEAKRID